MYTLPYKYSFNIGFVSLWDSVHQHKEKTKIGWIPEAESTMRRNIHRILKNIGDQWVCKYVYIGSKKDWKDAANESGIPKDLKGSLLLLDSFDKKICRSKESPQEDEWWSGKISHRAARYQEIQDFSGFINFISPAYSPKVYDSHWVQVKKTGFWKIFGVFLSLQIHIILI